MSTYFSGLEFSMGGSFPGYLDRFSHVPTFFGLQYNHAGGVRLRVNRKRWFEFDGPCAFLTSPRVHVDYGPIGESPRQHHFVCFFGPRVQRMIAAGLIDPTATRPLVPVRQPRRFLQGMRDLIAAVREAPRRATRDDMVLQLESLLLQLHQDAVAGDIVPLEKHGWFEGLLKAVKAEPRANWDFTDEARQLHITPQHFRRRFKLLAGMAPQQFVIEQRLCRAAELLRGSDEPVASIGNQVGIESGFYLSRLFKRRFGLSPANYRREWRRLTDKPVIRSDV